jgi:hypothetical protein
MMEIKDTSPDNGHSGVPWQRLAPTPVHFVLGVMGFVVGIVAAIYSYKLLPSAWLALFVFAQAVYLVGRGLPDVIIKSLRLQRAIYYLLLPVFCSAILYIMYQPWGVMWVAVIVGLVAGSVLHWVVARLFLPDVARKEHPPEKINLHEERWREPARYDSMMARTRDEPPAPTV